MHGYHIRPELTGSMGQPWPLTVLAATSACWAQFNVYSMCSPWKPYTHKTGFLMQASRFNVDKKVAVLPSSAAMVLLSITSGIPNPFHDDVCDVKEMGLRCSHQLLGERHERDLCKQQ